MIDTKATFLPSQFHWNGREGQTPKWLIIHGTAGGTSAQAIASWFQNPQALASTNYSIGQDGMIVCSVDEANAAWANGALTAGHDAFWDTLNGVNPNLVTLSIEHCKPSPDNSDTLTPAQQAASFALVRAICQRWNIPMRAADATGGICGHDSIDPVNRANCPGPYPWSELYAFLHPSSPAQQESSMPVQPLSLSNPIVASFFFQDGAMWRCKFAFDPATGQMKPASNGAILGNAHLTFYQDVGGVDLNGLTLLGLPVTNEMRLGLAGTVETAVVYENGLAVYDPDHKYDIRPGSTAPVYLAHLFNGAGLQILKNALGHLTPSDPQVSVLEAQIAALEAQVKQAPSTQLTAQVQQLEAHLNEIETAAEQLASLLGEATPLVAQVESLAKV